MPDRVALSVKGQPTGHIKLLGGDGNDGRLGMYCLENQVPANEQGQVIARGYRLGQIESSDISASSEGFGLTYQLERAPARCSVFPLPLYPVKHLRGLPEALTRKETESRSERTRALYRQRCQERHDAAEQPNRSETKSEDANRFPIWFGFNRRNV